MIQYVPFWMDAQLSSSTFYYFSCHHFASNLPHISSKESAISWEKQFEFIRKNNLCIYSLFSYSLLSLHLQFLLSEAHFPQIFRWLIFCDEDGSSFRCLCSNVGPSQRPFLTTLSMVAIPLHHTPSLYSLHFFPLFIYPNLTIQFF